MKKKHKEIIAANKTDAKIFWNFDIPPPNSSLLQNFFEKWGALPFSLKCRTLVIKWELIPSQQFPSHWSGSEPTFSRCPHYPRQHGRGLSSFSILLGLTQPCDFWLDPLPLHLTQQTLSIHILRLLTDWLIYLC